MNIMNTNNRQASNSDNKNGISTMTANIDLEAIDTVLEQELNQLSFQERNEIHEEIHGVWNPCPNETPQMLLESLGCLSSELDMIRSKSAYNEAQHLPKTYVNDDDFRLRFLRCELFDAKRAAHRMVTFLECVLDYFGPEALRRPIQLNDFRDDDLDCLKVGYHQLLPYCDRSGRRIIANVADFGFGRTSLRTRGKIFLYLLWAATDDLETQRNGVVILFVPNSKLNFLPNWNEPREAIRLFQGIPSRLISFHCSFPEAPISHFIRGSVLLAIGAKLRSKVRFYSERGVELNYHLAGYGIPVDLIPLSESGAVKDKNHKQWMKARKAIESFSNDDGPAPIECPLKNDVIFRSGTKSMSHPGNVMFRGLLEEHFQDHVGTSSYAKKAEVSLKIVMAVKEKNGRFLEWDQRGWWREIQDEQQIRSKISITLRDFKKTAQAKKRMQMNMSDTYQFERQDGRKRKRNEGGGEDAKEHCTCMF